MEFHLWQIMLFYAFIIAVLALGGYFTGEFIKLTKNMGAIVGAVIGLVISIILWFTVGKNMVKKA